jgi:hypothetical protein
MASVEMILQLKGIKDSDDYCNQINDSTLNITLYKGDYNDHFVALV